MRQIEQGFDGVELGGEAKLDGRVPCPEVADRGGKRAGQMLDAKRIGVAGRLEGSALPGPAFRSRRNCAPAQIGSEVVQDLG